MDNRALLDSTPRSAAGGLLVVLAHPDDETMCSGLMTQVAGEGRAVTLVCATRGEMGEIADPALATPPTLGAVREAELRRACAQLGVGDVRFLGYRDSGMAGTAGNDDPAAFINADPQRVTGQLVALIRELRPSTVITFEPFGVYGHPDHIAVSRWTAAAFDSAGEAHAFGEAGRPWQPEHLYYAAMRYSWMVRVMERAGALGLDATGFAQVVETYQEYLAAVEEQITDDVDVSDYTAAKTDSLSCHRTQLGPGSTLTYMLRPELVDFLGQESFILVR